MERSSCSDILLKIFLSVLVLTGVGSCSENVPDDPVLYQKLLDETVGMTKEKSVNGVTLKSQYQPPELLALINSKGSSGNFQKALEEYNNQMSFVLLVESKEEGEDILTRGLQGYEDYQSRVQLLNFEIKDYITLEVGGRRLKPVLGTMENTYGLRTGRKLIVVFAGHPEDLLQKNTEFDLIFQDPVFGTGINRFRYTTSDILNAPLPQT